MSRASSPRRTADQPVDGIAQLVLGSRHLLEAVALLDAFEEGAVAPARLGDRPHELFERRACVGLLEELVRALEQLVETRPDHGSAERVLGREAAEHRAMAHPCPACDLVDRHIGPQLGVGVGGRRQDAAEVALRVCAQNGHDAPTTTGSRNAASSMRAT